MRFLVVLLVLFPFGGFAQDETAPAPQRPEPVIDYKTDWKYFGGEYLIFDCERRHYACVSLEGNANCIEERKFAMEKKADRYPCAPISKFADKKLCVLKNYQIVDRNAPKRFCYPK
jgi:hypothetical protein